MKWLIYLRFAVFGYLGMRLLLLVYFPSIDVHLEFLSRVNVSRRDYIINTVKDYIIINVE